MLQLYEETCVQDIAAKIREKLKIEDKISLREMPTYIDEMGTSGGGLNIDIVPSHLDNAGNWVRPAEYEDLSQIEANLDDDTQEVYLSLYNGNRGLWHLGLYATCLNGYKVELGHVVNGTFVISDTYTQGSNTYFRLMLPEAEQTMVARVTPQSSDNHITNFKFCNIPVSTSGKAVDIQPLYQSVVERIGRLPYLASVLGDTYTSYAGVYLERDALKFGYKTSVNNLSSTWSQCYNLQKLEVSDIDTSQWRPTSLNNMFNQCRSLYEIDLSGWDTENWAITDMSFVFNYCLHLHKLNLPWNTSNWKVTTLTQMFCNCLSLQQLDLSAIPNWDTSNWKVTSLSSLFVRCSSLKALDLSNWDVSNWAVNNISSMFSGCYSLKSVNFANWNTSNWTRCVLSFGSCYSLESVNLEGWDLSKDGSKSFSSMFSACYSLKQVNLKNWKFGSVAFTSMASMFSSCYSLEEVDLSSWDTSNFAITSLSSMFSGCWSLKRINLKSWNTSNWKVTDLSSMFYNCYSLQEIDLDTWDTTSWAVTAIGYLFNQCTSLCSLKIGAWNTSNWKVNSVAQMFYNCFNLQYVDLSGWDGSNWPSNISYSSFITNCYKLSYLDIRNLREGASVIAPSANYVLSYFNPPVKTAAVSSNYSTLSTLSHDSIITIFTKLPTITTSATITLGALRCKLTTEEIAIATQKGWTVA